MKTERDMGRIARTATAVGFALILAFAATGCSSPEGGESSGKIDAGDPSVPPRYRPGDSLTYASGNIEGPIFVTGVEGDRVRWADNAGNSWTTFPDPTIPPREENHKADGTSLHRVFAPAEPTVFPLEAGKHIQYSATVLQSGRTTIERNDCTVSRPRPITVEAGTFEAWQILCQRENYTETFFYAPAVGAVVLKRRETSAGVERATLADYHKAGGNKANEQERMRASGGQAPVAIAEPRPPVSAEPLAPPSPSGPAVAAPTPLTVPGNPSSTPAVSPAPSPTPMSASTSTPAAPKRIAPKAAPAAAPQQAAAPRSTPATPAAAPSQIASLPAGSYVVQLAALHSAKEADQSWQRMRNRLPQLLGTLNPLTDTVTSTSGSQFVRLAVGPFANEQQAHQLCVRLRAAGQDCWARSAP